MGIDDLHREMQLQQVHLLLDEMGIPFPDRCVSTIDWDGPRYVVWLPSTYADEIDSHPRLEVVKGTPAPGVTIRPWNNKGYRLKDVD